MGVIDALSAGLVEAARRPWLMLIPLATEFVLWLAPPLSIAQLLQRFMRLWEGLIRAAYTPAQFEVMSGMVGSMREMMAQVGAHLNLLESLSGGWLGAPSALSGVQVTRMTFISDLVLAPAGLAMDLPQLAAAPWQGAPIEITSLGALLFIMIGLWLTGQVLAAIYLRWAAATRLAARRDPVVAAAVAASPTRAVEPAARHWAGSRGLFNLIVRLTLYSIALGLVLLALRLPLALALGLLWLSSSSAVGLMMLLFGGVALWLTLWFLVSLFFVNEAILLDGQSIWRAVARSILLVHNNFWPTLGLGLLINLLIYGFRAVWNLIGHTPAGAAVSLVGNAYLGTGLLLAVFVFYENLARRGTTRRVVSN